MKGQQSVSLARAAKRDRVRRSKAESASWEGVDSGLFEALRGLRKRLADEQGVPPFVVFSDATLRELARHRPSTLECMRNVYGIGEAKLASFGDVFLARDCGLLQGKLRVARYRRATDGRGRRLPDRR